MDGNNAEDLIDIPVVIIGNGPSGLALSAILAGWTPYYNFEKGHPSRAVHALFEGLIEGKKGERSPIRITELLDREDLANLSVPSNGGASPMAALIDILTRPDADLGHEHPPALTWALGNHGESRADPTGRVRGVPRVDHVCLGEGRPGGSWQYFDATAPTVSHNTWFHLPGYNSFPPPSVRCASAAVRNYFEVYPKCALIEPYMVPYTKVVGLDREGEYWRVKCERVVEGDGGNRTKWAYRAKVVVFAAGVNLPVKLGLQHPVPPLRMKHTSIHLATLCTVCPI